MSSWQLAVSRISVSRPNRTEAEEIRQVKFFLIDSGGFVESVNESEQQRELSSFLYALYYLFINKIYLIIALFFLFPM